MKSVSPVQLKAECSADALNSVDAVDDIEKREAAFWDTQTERITDEQLRSQSVGSEPLDATRISFLGDLRGKRVLDVGCGAGLWTVHLAKLGAEVWAIDISPHSVELTQRRAGLNGVAEVVHAQIMSATSLEFGNEFFDAVHGQDIIHHLDPTAFGNEINRVLKPGGGAVFSENCANNPLLMFARNRICGKWGVPKWSSDDEYPLTRARIAQFAKTFSSTTIAFPEFVCFHFIDAKLFRYKSRFISSITHGLDRAIYMMLPILRSFSYRQIIQVTK